MLYYAPPILTLAPHTSVTPHAGILSGVMRNLMLLASPYASGRCGMANCELRVGKGGLLIIMSCRSEVDYCFSQKNGNIVLLSFFSLLPVRSLRDKQFF
jgi:hypothetical protein